ncbi:MAG: hypothetical protein KIS86_13010 [Devosia sp.]|nr:hypothetical protein [Devosia sp.]
MIWWIVAAYLAVALLCFVAMARNMEPLDGRAWLTVLLLALFWPAALVWFAIP